LGTDALALHYSPEEQRCSQENNVCCKPSDPLSDHIVFIPIRDFCRRFHVGRTKAYELIASGAIEAVKVGRRTLIVEASAIHWAASLPTYTTARPEK
jgi:excisionase family DNA binding protein